VWEGEACCANRRVSRSAIGVQKSAALESSPSLDDEDSAYGEDDQKNKRAPGGQEACDSDGQHWKKLAKKTGVSQRGVDGDPRDGMSREGRRRCRRRRRSAWCRTRRRTRRIAVLPDELDQLNFESCRRCEARVNKLRCVYGLGEVALGRLSPDRTDEVGLTCGEPTGSGSYPNNSGAAAGAGDRKNGVVGRAVVRRPLRVTPC
jgi:hypothetical protein